MSIPTTEKELRRWLAKRLRIASLEEPVWKMLRNEGYVRDAVDHPHEEALGDLVERARILRRFRSHGRSLRAPRRPVPLAPEKLVTHGEWQRAKVFSAQIARLVTGRRDVRELRARVFPQGLLSISQARDLLRSCAARYFPLGFFRQHGIPLVEHRTSFFDSDRPPDIGAPSWSETTRLLIEWPGGNHTEPLTWEVHLAETAPATPRLAILGTFFGVLPGSVFDEMRTPSTEIAEHYDWSEADATWFILTGKWPLFRPVLVRPTGGWQHDHTHLRLRFEVEPWASSRSVLNVFRHMQRLVLGARGRPLSAQNLELFDFVSERVMQSGGSVSWGTLRDEWNRSARGVAYLDRRRLARDFKRTGQKLMFPPVNWPSAGKAEVEQKKSASGVRRLAAKRTQTKGRPPSPRGQKRPPPRP